MALNFKSNKVCEKFLLSIIILIFTFISQVKCLELQCRTLKESPEVCLITKKGDFSNETLTFVSNKAPEIKQIKVIRVNVGGQIPTSGLKTFKKLEAITFEACGIETLDGFKGLKSVQQIFLNRNEISSIPDVKFNSKVVYIEAQYNKLENISKNAFKNLENLYWIDFSNNRIKKLPRKLFHHNHDLTSINLSNNRIKNIRHVFKKQGNLRFLRLSNNKIGRITDETFKSLRNLRELELASNKIMHIDSGAFDSCHAMTLLNLSKNFLKNLHITIPSKSLSFLYLMDNCFVNLTVDYKEKPIRMLLDVSNSAENEAEHEIKVKFQKGLPVTTLNLANNHLSTVNPIANVARLHKLTLTNNTLLGNSSLMRLLTLTDIFDLNLQGVNLTPDQLTTVLQIKSLKILDVSDNDQLSNVKWDQQPSSLIKLLLNNCNLTKINIQAIKKTFPRLKELHISGNKFTCDYLKDLVNQLLAVGIRAQINLDEINKCPWFSQHKPRNYHKF